jgi:hypothetical protein
VESALGVLERSERMDSEREDDQRDDAALEVSDLRPKARWRTRGSGVGRAPRRIVVTLDARFARTVALVGLALVVTLGVLLANSPGLRAGIGTSLAGPTATPTAARFTIVTGGFVQITVAAAIPSPTPFPTPTPFAPPLGPIPTTCAPSATQPSVGGIPNGATAVGAGSVWLDAFDGARATIAITRDASDPYSLYGWPIPIALAFKSGFTQPVTLRGDSLADGHPLWLRFGDPDGTPVPLFTLDPGDAQGLGVNGDSTGTRWWNGTLYLPGSGCFALEASWPGGQWRTVFAAGH